MHIFRGLPITGVLGLLSSPALAFDDSEYRQDTYGPPTQYCDPARALNDDGAGTLADPWNLQQCMSLPGAGDVVGILPGVAVPLPSTDDDDLPTFRPTNCGTSTARLVYVTRFAAVALSDLANNPNRTELRHDGTAPQADGDFEIGTGSAMYGTYQCDYVTFDGFYVDMAHAYPMGDSGVIRVQSSRGVHFRNFEIKGTVTNMQSNPIVYRPQNASDTVLSNFRVYDFRNDPSNSTVPQAALFSDQYGDQNVLIENFEIRNTERGIFFKGTAEAGTVFNYGTIRRGIVSDVSSCYQFNDLHPTNPTTLEYSLCYDVNFGAGVVLSSETSPARNLLVHHVTVARVNAGDINTNGAVYSRSNGIAANVQFRDNLFELDSGPTGHGIDFGAISGLPDLLDYNAYYKNGSAMSWAHDGVQYDSLAAWQTGINREDHSIVLASGPFVDRDGLDFHVTDGHAAKTASSTGGEVGAYAASQLIGVDLGPLLPPAAPSNLNVQ